MIHMEFSTDYRILIIEDDISLSAGICEFLTGEGFSVSCCADGLQAMDSVKSFDPHLIILDIMLPGMPGFEVLRRVKQWSDNVAVILLTARTEIHDKVSGFNLGADDYLTKPFDLMELLMRIRVWLRRTVVSKQEGEKSCDIADNCEKSVRVDNLVIHESARRVFLEGSELQLTRSEYVLLHYLAVNRGIVLERGRIMEYLWGTSSCAEPGTSRSVDVHISNLRRKFEAASLRPGIEIQTVHGVGYVLKSLES